MSLLKLEVRENAFVTLFTVYVDVLGILQQSAFKHEKPGIFTYQQEVNIDKPTLLVRFTIMGQGSDTQTPKGICLVGLDGSQLNPYLAAAIVAGNSAKSVEYIYMLSPSDSAFADVHHFDELLSNRKASPRPAKAASTSKAKRKNV